jgi:hypothetical protein
LYSIFAETAPLNINSAPPPTTNARRVVSKPRGQANARGVVDLIGLVDKPEAAFGVEQRAFPGKEEADAAGQGRHPLEVRPRGEWREVMCPGPIDVGRVPGEFHAVDDVVDLAVEAEQTTGKTTVDVAGHAIQRSTENADAYVVFWSQL